jgi:hypothetical protein
MASIDDTIKEFDLWYHEVERSNKESVHFSHIARHLMSTILRLKSLTDKNYYSEISSVLEAMDIYRRLIEQNPEFKEKEIRCWTGYFPELSNSKGSVEYVLEAANLLNQF